ncbi:MAG: S8 family serine peptidase [Anaerolineae bacterium]|nr:S8 family serine peptidase [Anaerolineae bacterium]
MNRKLRRLFKLVVAFFIATAGIVAVFLVTAGGHILTADPTGTSLESTRLVPNDPYFPLQWGLYAIKAPEACSITTGVTNTVIAILSAGVESNHPELKSKLLQGYDFVNDDTAAPQNDQSGLGSLLAGIVAADTNNFSGIAGVSWGARILPLKVFNDKGEASWRDTIEAIYFSGDYGADILVLTVDFPFYSEEYHEAVRYNEERGVFVVMSNLDGQGKGMSILADEHGVLVVRGLAHVQMNELNLGPPISSSPNKEGTNFICAPAEDGAGTWPKAVYQPWHSESLAAGYVAGVAALAWSVNPKLTVAEMKELLLTSASDIGPPGHDIQYGAAAGAVGVEREVSQSILLGSVCVVGGWRMNT